MGGSVIELDLSQPWQPEPPPASRWPRRPPAWFLPVLVTVATLLTVTAAAAPRRREPVLSLREPNTTVRFGPDDTTYVMTQRTRGGRLQAYPPGGSRPRWTVNFPGGHPAPFPVDDDPGLLVLTVFGTDPDGSGTGNLVQGRDAHTGGLLWSRPETSLLGFGAEVAVVIDRGESTGPASGAGRPAVIETVDRRTGQRRSVREVPPGVLVGWSDGLVIELADDGRLRLSDAATGATRGEARLTLAGDPLFVYVSGANLVVYQQVRADDGPAAQTAVTYDLASGVERSRGGIPAGGDCTGRYRCEAEPGRLTVVDAASGTVRYRGPGDRYVLSGDRLVVTRAPALGRPVSTQVVDLRTGRLERSLPGWSYAGSERSTAGWYGTGRRPRTILVIQPLAASGMLVAALDAATGRLAVLGRTTDWVGEGSCWRGARLVGCSGPAGVRVWRPSA